MKLERRHIIYLLKAIQDRELNIEEVALWGREETAALTDEELQRLFEDLHKRTYPKTCERLKRAGCCVECNTRKEARQYRNEAERRLHNTGHFTNTEPLADF